MEHIRGRRKTSEFARENVIGNMPDIVITNILDRLPLRDAVRTGVLSRNWRFKWTLLSHLIFDEEFYAYLLETRNENIYKRIINSVLLHLSGAITKFVLIIDGFVDAKYINDWILFLSRKGIRDITLKNLDDTPLELPTRLFSCLELKRLKVINFCFSLPRSFRAFPNLLSMELCLSDGSRELEDENIEHGDESSESGDENREAEDESSESGDESSEHGDENRNVEDESSDLGYFFTRCPLLESLGLRYLDSICNVQLVEMAKLENLKVLSFSLCDLYPKITHSSTIFELVGHLPKLQELDLDFVHCNKLTGGDGKKSSHIVFPCLKALTLSKIDLDNDVMVSCFFEMMRSFPNLHTLKISTCESIDNSVTPALCSLFSSPEMYSMMLLQLQSVDFTYFKASVNDLYLVKYLLACSPFLKRIVIRPQLLFLVSSKKSMFDRKLLKLHRASPLVDIDLPGPL